MIITVCVLLADSVDGLEASLLTSSVVEVLVTKVSEGTAEVSAGVEESSTVLSD